MNNSPGLISIDKIFRYNKKGVIHRANISCLWYNHRIKNRWNEEENENSKIK